MTRRIGFDSTSHMLACMSSYDRRLPKGPWDAFTDKQEGRTPIGILGGCTLQDEHGHDCFDPDTACVRIEFANYHMNDHSKSPQSADNMQQVDEAFALCALRTALPEFIRAFSEMHATLKAIAPTSPTGTWATATEMCGAAQANFNAASGMADEYARRLGIKED